MFGFLDKDKYSSYAKEAIDMVEHSDLSPDDAIQKISVKYSLNPHQAQRVVEEYNISMFLNKLKEGTQHENFLLANPIIDECEKWTGVSMSEAQATNASDKMEKTAGFEESVYIPYAAFEYKNGIDVFDDNHVQGEFLYEDADLEKVASAKTLYRQQVQEQELIKQASYLISKAEDELSAHLIKIANTSPLIAKQTIHALVKVGADHLAEDVLVGCKYKPKEILDSSIANEFLTETELNKLASIKELIKEIPGVMIAKKVVIKGGDTGKEVAKHIIEKSKEHPGILAAILMTINRIKKHFNEEPKKPLFELNKELDLKDK